MRSDSEKIADVEELFNFVLKVQDKIAPEIVNPNEEATGEGRKGVIMIRRGDGRGDKYVKVFEVINGKLVPSDSIDHARTVIVFEGVDAFVSLCQELLANKPGAFSRARARGEVKVIGEHAIRDLSIFNRLLGRVGRILGSYNVKLGD